MAKTKHGAKSGKKSKAAAAARSSAAVTVNVGKSRAVERKPESRPPKRDKKKHVELDDDSVLEMRKQLASVKCKLVQVEADGNCLFRAIGDQLFGDQQQHGEIRKRIVDYIETKRDEFEPFMEDEEKFDQYCRRMRDDGTWGGNQEIYAAARLFAVYIVIHQTTSRMVIECDSQKPTRMLHLAYHGSDHYDSVRAQQDEHLDAPPAEVVLDLDGFRPEELAQRWKGKTQQAASADAAPPSSASDAKVCVESDTTDAALAQDMATLDISSPHTVVLSKKAQRKLKKQLKLQPKRT